MFSFRRDVFLFGIALFFLAFVIPPFFLFLLSIFFSGFFLKPLFYPVSFFLCLLYMGFPVPWDVYHNFYRVFYEPEVGLNFYTTLISFFVSLGVSYYSIVFLFSLVSAFIYSYVFNARVALKRASLFFVLFAFFLVFEFRFFLDLQKTTLSLSLFVLAVFSINRWCKWPLLFLSFITHPLMGGLCFLFFISKFISLKDRWWYFLIALAFFLSVNMSFFISNMGYFLGYGVDRVFLYLSSAGTRYSSDLVSFFVKWLRLISVALMFFYCVRLKFRNDDIILNFIKFLCVFCFFISVSEIGLERYYYALVVVFLIYSVKFKRVNFLFLLAMIFICINYFLHGFYSIGVIFSDGYGYYLTDNRFDNFYSLFWKPSIMHFNLNGVGLSDDFMKFNMSIKE